MNTKIIFATGNEGKIKEIRAILGDDKFEILSMKQAGVYIDIEETGSTFEENAIIKAKAVWDITGGIVLADDSGLVIDYLNGEPGIYSARYLGEETSYIVKNKDIIRRMEGTLKEDRKARFVAVIAAVLSDGSILTSQGMMEGIIASEPSGTEGFGYDPILYLEEYDKTSAELTMEEKNSISHRGKALKNMKAQLIKCCKSGE